ncbi:MAG: 5-formyltetrahydrofolate cyclo-ligase [Desulfuromusa sp.]|nr:5-formyltetrahydrofolate cyclo-ligase [Desulfuromusa sp.]
MGKKIIRKQFLDCRKQLDLSTYSRLSEQAQRQLIGSEGFIRAKTLALYSPINNEVATKQIFIAARELGKQVFYPRVAGEDLEFIKVYAVNELQPGAFGVAEPGTGEKIPFVELDLIVVPGVAFDLRGHRLGYGRGFYDRQLTGRSAGAVAVGLCFETQLCDRLPTEAHDQALDCIATETRFIPCHI